MDEPQEKITEECLVNRFHYWFMMQQSKRTAKIVNEFSGGTFLEVGCGHGWISDELKHMGRRVTKTDFYSSDLNVIHVDAHNIPFADKSYDCIICSNTLEHLHTPLLALKEMHRVGDRLWLAWTPWYSPFGGHEFSPWHYFGKSSGKTHQLGRNLYKTTVTETLHLLQQAGWRVDSIRPRYWPMLKFLSRWKWTREWATWNVEVLCSKLDNSPTT